jgi:hypothetical protein
VEEGVRRLLLLERACRAGGSRPSVPMRVSIRNSRTWQSWCVMKLLCFSLYSTDTLSPVFSSLQLRLLPPDATRGVRFGNVMSWLDGRADDEAVSPEVAELLVSGRSPSTVATILSAPAPDDDDVEPGGGKSRAGNAAAEGADDDMGEEGGARAPSAEPVTEAQKAEKWTRWLSAATALLAPVGTGLRTRAPSWASAISLRTQALAIPRLKTSGVGAGPYMVRPSFSLPPSYSLIAHPPPYTYARTRHALPFISSHSYYSLSQQLSRQRARLSPSA